MALSDKKSMSGDYPSLLCCHGRRLMLRCCSLSRPRFCTCIVHNPATLVLLGQGSRFYSTAVTKTAVSTKGPCQALHESTANDAKRSLEIGPRRAAVCFSGAWVPSSSCPEAVPWLQRTCHKFQRRFLSCLQCAVAYALVVAPAR